MRPHPFLSSRGDRGVSLLELAVALGVCATVAALGAIVLRPLIDRGRLEAAARELATDLRYARALAAAENRAVRVVLEPEAERYRLEAVAAGAAEPIERPRDWRGRGVDLVGSTGGSEIAFAPLGTTSDWTTVTLANAAGRRRITVVASGRVRLIGPE